MTTAGGGAVRASFADAATALAGHVLDTLGDDGEVGLAAYVASAADTTAALAAVRVVGADVLAPHVLLGRPPAPGDVAVVADSFAVFPPVAVPTTPQQRIAAWQDWALTRLAGMESREVGARPDGVWEVLGAETSWQRWTARVAQLSPLAQPGLGGPITSAVARHPRMLTMGATRAVLRRDYITAARLARWIALLAVMNVDSPLDPALLVEHVRLHAGGSRLLLDITVACRLLGLGPA